jgi:hypothetical protein
MPESVLNAAPASVMPWSLCKAFSHSREYVVLENEYRNGESQRSRLTETSRKLWKPFKRLTPTLLAELRAFYEARLGNTEPFYFYDVWETYPKFSYDPTGSSPVGRYIVHFEGRWNQMIGMGRADVDISLVELA